MITPSFGLTATERVLPKLALDFTTASLDSRITFTRTTGASNPATYVNSNGYITAATNNQPRFDYDPVTLICKGLLIEESRVNLVLWSGDQTVLPWLAQVTGTATISTTQNYSVAPDNTQTATRVVMNLNGGGGSTANYCWLTQDILVTSGVSYSMSFYAKTNDGTTKTISVRDDSSAATFNTLKTVTGTWQRITVTGTAAATVAAKCKIWLRGAIGTSTEADLSVWGFQWEAGAFATSYIPTTTTALTRNADVATMTGTNFSDWFNASEGTFVVKTDALNGASASGFSLDNGTSSNQIIVPYNNSKCFVVLNGGAVQVNAGGSIASGNCSVIYKANDFYTARNAGGADTDTSGTVPTVSQLGIGCRPYGPSFFANGCIQQIDYWPMRLLNAEGLAISK